MVFLMKTLRYKHSKFGSPHFLVAKTGSAFTWLLLLLLLFLCSLHRRNKKKQLKGNTHLLLKVIRNIKDEVKSTENAEVCLTICCCFSFKANARVCKIYVLRARRRKIH